MNSTFTHYNLGCGRVHMDINRCRWVYTGVLGCRDTKLQQNEGMRDKIGQTGSDCDRMAGEISPNVTFL